jgi:cell division initiation protein
MKLTPLDIKRQEFKRAIRGYDAVEVDTFMDMIAGELEEALRAQKELRDSATQLDIQLKDYRTIEKTLQQTLLQAQETTGKTYEAARKEAELIVREAEQKAAKIVEQAQTDLGRLQNELVSLQGRKEGLVNRLRVLLTTELDVLRTLGAAADDEHAGGASLGTGKETIEIDRVLRGLENERTPAND